jgi:alginate O-acetyltransferase complex protein AlgJ
VHDPAKTIFLSERKDWTVPQILLTGAAAGKTLPWIRDSFGSEMLLILKRHFSKIIMVHLQDGFFRQG